jgi:hypothetical protein
MLRRTDLHGAAFRNEEDGATVTIFGCLVGKFSGMSKACDEKRDHRRHIQTVHSWAFCFLGLGARRLMPR